MDKVDIDVIIFFACICFGGWLACVHTTPRLIKAIGINPKYYPQGYIMLSDNMIRLFRLKWREIPRWCYHELLFSFVYIIYFFAGSAVYLLSDDSFASLQFFVRGWEIIVIVHMLHLIVFNHLYKRKRKNCD